MGRRPEINGRELLVHAALKLFAAEGVEGVSIRAVNREAGLGPASMHYHFGTKDALVEAVLHLHGDEMVEGMKHQARQLIDTDQPVTAHDLVTMYAQLYLDLMSKHPGTGHDWVRLVSQLVQSDPERVIDPTTSKLTRAVAARIYPESSPAQIERAMRMCFLLLVTQLAQMSPRPRAKSLSSVDLDLLVDFLSGGLDNTLSSDPDRGRVATVA